jgi:MFS family permease
VDPVQSERSGSKASSAVAVLLLVGLVLGGFAGGWIGGIVGTHQSDAAEAAGECYLEGCAYEVLGYAFLGLLLGAIFGAIIGGLVGKRMRRTPTPPSASGRLEP